MAEQETGRRAIGEDASRCCISCRREGVRLRRCTNERLCVACRQSLEFKIWTLKHLLSKTALTEECVEDLQVGWTVNPRDPRFSRQKIYREKDVLARVRQLHGAARVQAALCSPGNEVHR